MKKIFILISLLILVTTSIGADSLWRTYSEGIYQPSRRRISVGDIVTIYVSESTSAVQQASTSSGKTTSLTSSLADNWDQVANLLGNERVRKKRDISIGGGDRYQGNGQTTRKSNVKAIITAIVTEVLKSGNLFVVGEHKVKVNHDIETIRVSGIVRPADVTPKNTIFSYQIAKAEVSVSGRGGPVAAKQNPGIISRIFNWVF
ncbi:MAG: flagellar basal body L-ring protein FlgH [bacterium]